MATIVSFEILATDLPFDKPFKHAAAERASSYSLFLRCATDSGTVGYGESLPREYVTGESRDGAVDVLRDRMLPPLIGRSFGSLEEVEGFLRHCNGKAPAAWVDPGVPQTAAWGAVDLALLDTFGREQGATVLGSAGRSWPSPLRYSGVLSSDGGSRMVLSALKMRLFGLRSIKWKVERSTSEDSVQRVRRALGRGTDLRVDANMAWSPEEAIEAMAMMSRHGIRCFEQPLPPDDLEGLSRLVKETGLDVMADESLTDSRSLERLLERQACTAVNVRISKCGGLVAARARCEEALAAGLKVQIGCQVGESSLLSAAHLALVSTVRHVAYAEGCFGHHLLREDPASPLLQFGYGGRPPAPPRDSGLGVKMNESVLRRLAVRRETVGAADVEA